jgi:hypothetical protein
VIFGRWGTRWRAIAGLVAAGLAGLLAWVLWPSGPAGPAPRARPYLGFTACLLTDGHGVVGSAAAPVWAGMQDASLATHAKVQYLAVTDGSTAADASAFLAGLIQRHCDLVLAVGAAPTAAVATDAATYPPVRFVVVGGGRPAGNVSVVDAGSPAQVRDRIAAVVSAAVRAAIGGK